MKKQEVLALVEQMPDEIDTDELIYRLYLKEKLLAADAQAEAGEVISQEELEQEIQGWVESSRRTPD